MELGSSLISSQEYATDPHPMLAESSLHVPTLFL
jgi:hypothetical protein